MGGWTQPQSAARALLEHFLTLVQLGVGDEWRTQVQTALSARTYGRTALEQYPRRQSTDCPEADPNR